MDGGQLRAKELVYLQLLSFTLRRLKTMPEAYYRYHVFFCINQREAGNHVVPIRARLHAVITPRTG